jgi:hypothetical protein
MVEVAIDTPGDGPPGPSRGDVHGRGRTVTELLDDDGSHAREMNLNHASRVHPFSGTVHVAETDADARDPPREAAEGEIQTALDVLFQAASERDAFRRDSDVHGRFSFGVGDHARVRAFSSFRVIGETRPSGFTVSPDRMF